MSNSWENYESAPLEQFHGDLMDEFHKFRKGKGGSVEVLIDGSELNNLIAKVKNATYKKYPNQFLERNAIKKSEF